MKIPFYVASLVYSSESGILSKGELVARIDDMIRSCDDVPLELIDASFAQNKCSEEICMFLRDYTLKYEIDDEEVKRYIVAELKMMYNKKRSLEKVTECLYKLATQCPFFVGAEEQEMHSISDAYYLAKNNICGSLEQIKDRLDHFLNNYATR